jgi:hypothetical protein
MGERPATMSTATSAVSEWTFTGTAADGSLIETEGVDLFTFAGGRIRTKNAFRKMRPNLPPGLR